MAVVLPALVLGSDDDQKRFGAGVALLALASQAHVVLFGLAGLGLAAVVVARTVRTRAVAAGAVRGAALLGALAFALLAGGFFHTPEAPARFLWVGHFRAAFHAGVLGSIALNLVLFAPALATLPFAVFRARAGGLRLALVVAAAAGFIAGNVVSYERSWDIVKLFGAAAFCANLLLADVLAAAVARVRPAVVACVAAACAVAGGVWLVRFGPLNGAIAPRYTERAPAPLARDLDARFGDVVGLAPVLTDAPQIQELGFALVGFDWRDASVGFLVDRDRRDALTKLRDRALTSLSLADVRATGARFVLVRAGRAVDPALERVGDVDDHALYRVP